MTDLEDNDPDILAQEIRKGLRDGLSGANLSGADLSGVDLSVANLEGANLEGTNLEGTNLDNATLDRANLKGANLKGARLSNATLYHANLSGANLEGANLDNASVSSANLKGANLVEADLSDADFEGANLEKARLDNVVAPNANFSNTKLMGADLSKSDYEDDPGGNFQGAKFINADLSETYRRQFTDLGSADFSFADFEGANLERANLQNADFEHAIFEGANLQGITGQNASFLEAVLERANLENATLGNANLAGALLNNAILRNANLAGANLDGADLDGADLDGANLRGVSRIGTLEGREREAEWEDFPAGFPVEDLDEEPEGIAYEIHNAYNKIDMVKYVKLMEEILPPPPSPDLDFPEFHYTNMGLLEFINTNFTNFIYNSFNKADKTTYLPKWQAVHERLEHCIALDDPLLKSQIGPTIQFVFAQSDEFIRLYITTFIHDSYHAYEDEGAGGISCIKGMFERFIILVGDTLYIICQGKECNENEKKLLALLKTTLDINELTEEWNEQFLESESGPVDPDYKKMSRAERQDHYIAFMKKKYEDAGLASEENIDMIEERAKELDSYDGPFSDELAFGGGKKRKRGQRGKPAKKTKKKRGKPAKKTKKKRGKRTIKKIIFKIKSKKNRRGAKKTRNKRKIRIKNLLKN